MVDHELAMLAFVRLADLAQAKRQLLPRDKFLILAGAEACQGGWLEVAERCRYLVLANNPAHLLKEFETFASALRDPDFQVYLKQLKKFCSFERAEQLLENLQIQFHTAASEPGAAGEQSLAILKSW